MNQLPETSAGGDVACPKCGSRVSLASMFCPICGQRLRVDPGPPRRLGIVVLRIALVALAIVAAGVIGAILYAIFVGPKPPPSPTPSLSLAAINCSAAPPTFEVQQESMFPTLEEGDRLVIQPFGNQRPVQRGDVIVVVLGGPYEEISLIKRVIGLEGDVVEIRDQDVYVNGVLLEEPYLDGRVTDPFGDEDTWTIPAGMLFVMGDNRSNSTDSRAFGPIRLDDVVGQATYICFPLNHVGPIE